MIRLSFVCAWFVFVIVSSAIHSVTAKRKMAPFQPCYVNNGGCDQICTNVKQHNNKYTRTCSCRPNFKLLDDGRTCNGTETEKPVKHSTKPIWQDWEKWVDLGALRTVAFLMGVFVIGYMVMLACSKLCRSKKKKRVTKGGEEYVPLTTHVDPE